MVRSRLVNRRGGRRLRLGRAAPRPLSLDAWLAGRTRRRLLAVAAVVAVGLLLALDRTGLLTPTGGDHRRYHERTFTVVRVVDGDTLDVDVPDGAFPHTRVRLWGVDTAEMHYDDQGVAHPEPWAEQATQFTRKQAEGRTVRLLLEPHSTRGRHGRLLAYVELPDGRVLNERLLLEGLARADRRFEHQHLSRYVVLEEQARMRGLGMWSR